MLTIAFTACDFGNNDGNTATVRINFTGNSNTTRALDGENLPFFNDTSVKIVAIDLETGRYFETDCGPIKNASIKLPVNHKYKLKVKIYNEIGIWMGTKNFKVKGKRNKVSIKINKNAIGWRPIGFSVDASNKYTLYTPSKTLENPDKFYGDNPFFCTDNKGGLYLIGEDGVTQLLTTSSEGDLNPSAIEFPSLSSLDLAYDYKTGKSYLSGSNGNWVLKLIEKNASGKPKKTDIPGNIGDGHIAVHNNMVFVKNDSISGDGLGFWEIPLNPSSSLISITSNSNYYFNSTGKLITETLMKTHPISKTRATINDIFVDDNSIYLLLSDLGWGDVDPEAPIISSLANSIQVGCILKIDYSISEQSVGTPAPQKKLNLSNPQFFGLGKFKTAPEKEYILPESYYKDNFYKPIKFIGFDGDNLYIADDGIQYDGIATTGGPKFKANVNRIACFNTTTEKLSFEDAPAGVTWAEER